jgi:catechol 2,3-dioxygenase-like lactoylglutathione lyase family enzyme
MSLPGLGAFSHVTIGVTSLAEASRFWRDNFGLEVRAKCTGPDEALAGLWNMAPSAIVGQALVATPAGKDTGDHRSWATAGALHLVEFRDPQPPVRQGAKVYDRLPKNLDLYTVDLPTRYGELAAAGHRFRAGWSEMRAGSDLFREVHLPGHDEINVVLLEVIGPGYATPMTSQGYAGIGPLVTIVGNADAEASFYREVLGMATTLELALTGPDIERTVGLPPGAGLKIRVFGDPAEPLGRIEIIEYQQVEGEDLYPRARPPATGILHMNFRVPDLAPIRARLGRADVAMTEHGQVASICGTGPMLSFNSPAGLRIEVQGVR